MILLIIPGMTPGLASALGDSQNTNSGYSADSGSSSAGDSISDNGSSDSGNSISDSGSSDTGDSVSDTDNKSSDNGDSGSNSDTVDSGNSSDSGSSSDNGSSDSGSDNGNSSTNPDNKSSDSDNGNSSSNSSTVDSGTTPDNGTTSSDNGTTSSNNGTTSSSENSGSNSVKVYSGTSSDSGSSDSISDTGSSDNLSSNSGDSEVQNLENTSSDNESSSNESSDNENLSSGNDSSDSSSDSSSSSSGSGLAVISSEPSSNIAVKEYSTMNVMSGYPVKFDFVENSTCITYIKFDPTKTFRQTTAIVEELKNTSALASTPPPGKIYKNVDIWVGEGAGLPSSLKDGSVGFRVEKSWIKEQNISDSRITLQRYDNGWKSLSTEKVGEDENYVYFEAETPGYSCFAITDSTGQSEDGNKTLVEQEITKTLKTLEANNSMIQNPMRAGRIVMSVSFPLFLAIAGYFVVKRKI